MKITLAFLLFILALASCSHTVEHTFYYSDGTVIKDSMQIRMLTADLDSSVSQEHYADIDLSIETSLRSGGIESFTHFTDSLRSEIMLSLKNRYPEYVTDLDSLLPGQVFNVGVIVLDNHTGKVLHYLENNRRYDLISSDRLMGASNKLYGFILAMDKNYNATDVYHYNEPSRILDRFGNEEAPYKFSVSMHSLFSVQPGGARRRYPFQDYACEDWKKLNAQLRLNLKFDSCDPEWYILFESNFLTLCKTYMMLGNNGIHRTPTFIEKVKTIRGNVIYTNTIKEERVLKESTIKDLDSLLEGYMKIGTGRYIDEQLDLHSQYRIYNGQSQNSEWLLCADNGVTIGIIICHNKRLFFKNGKSQSFYAGNEWHAPRKCMRLLKFYLSQLTTNE